MPQNARERVREMQRRERAAVQRRRNLVVSAVVVVVIALVVVIVVFARMGGSGGTATSAGAPQGTVDTYAVPRGDKSAPVTMTMYEDFQCPACQATEHFIGGTIDQLVDQGKVRVLYRPIAFLDSASTTDYSSRSLNAAACVLDQQGTDAYVRMHNLLYANQPPEGSAGLPDEKLADLAVQAGAKRSAVTPCIKQQRFADWVDAATEQASKDGVNATPTILVDGEQLKFTSNEDPRQTLRQAVEQAAQG